MQMLSQTTETTLRFLIEDNGGELRISEPLANYLRNWQMADIAFDPDSKEPRLIMSHKLRKTMAYREKLKREQEIDNKKAQVARETFAALTTLGIDRKIATALTSLQADNLESAKQLIEQLLSSRKN
jgi:hypothetical protein